ncbi:antimicrobial resistance protein Mig-14 [Rothia nasimurium]|uniref:GNAT family N-acetyltransferase n=1 Tax=Luteibacter anthropi TaxID=564369 RepID=A0A7X5UAM5_9GAMM|nr:GNAT family N-acetyltransferase [Luteibacter anthropi]NII06827.1 GNAT family N-acetyltransferase [Luteibacter anthropi]
MLKKILSGWQRSDHDTYRRAYERFGGSLCAHPAILAHLDSRGAGPVAFYHKEVQGQIVGAYFVDSNDVIAHPVTKAPVIFDNIILPMDPGHRTYLPARSKRLSHRHRGQFLNFAYGALNRRTICLVKDEFSQKTRKNRRAELNRFLDQGGEIHSVDSFGDDELARIYRELFIMRWPGGHPGHRHDELAAFIGAIRSMMFGHVLFYKGRPCAYDLIYRAECPRWVYFDDHNGAMDPELNHFGLGSILLWLNIQTAREQCAGLGKEMIFSLGGAYEKWSYKKMWSHEHRLGRSLI